jgi:hypothetical protein
MVGKQLQLHHMQYQREQTEVLRQAQDIHAGFCFNVRTMSSVLACLKEARVQAVSPD